MEAEDKQPRVVKPAKSTVQRKKLMRFGLYGLGALAAIVLIVVLVNFAQNKFKTTSSNKLVSNVSNLEKTSGCGDGLKKLGSVGSSLGNASHYTNAAREKTLNYLMNCYLLTGNIKQSLTYANELSKLYVQEGNTAKSQQLSQMINYIKSFE